MRVACAFTAVVVEAAVDVRVVREVVARDVAVGARGVGVNAAAVGEQLHYLGD